MNWTHQMLDFHTWHKNHNKTYITLIGPIWQTSQNHTKKNLCSVQFWWMYAHIQTSEGYMEAQDWVQHHTKFKLFRIVSLFELFTCNLTFKGRYFAKTHFVGKSIKIQQVLTFLNNLLFFVSISLTSLWNSMNFLELSVN